MQGHKMLFNTGVRPCNRLNSEGKLILGRFDTIVNGTIHIAFYLETPPEPGMTLAHLVPESHLVLNENQVAIKIIGGGMLSDYAVFNK